MAFLQTAISESMPIGQLGRRVNMEEWNTVTRICGAANIPFARPVMRDGDKGVILMGADTLSAVGAADAGNTGAGAITASPTVAAGTRTGVYVAVLDSAGATAHFNLFDPDGVVIGDGVVGTPASIGGLGFTISDPGADPAIGDRFTITVSSDAEGFLGITEADSGLGHTTNPDEYQQYDNVAVMVSGTIWAMAGASVNAGMKAYYNTSTGRYTNNVAHVRVPNAEFDSTAVDGGLVKLRLVRVPA